MGRARGRSVPGGWAFLAAWVFAAWSAPAPVAVAGGAAGSERPPTAGDAPLSFEPNVGQADPAVRFVARQPGAALYFTASAVAVAMSSTGQPTAAGRDVHDLGPDGPGLPSPATHLPLDLASGFFPTSSLTALRGRPVPTQRPSVARLRFLHAGGGATPVGDKRVPGTVNYLRGEPASWRTRVPTYSAIVYRGLYPGIDLAYAGPLRQLKGTYTVAPHADPGRIRWRYDDADKVRVDRAGNLQVRVGTGAHSIALTEHAPSAWQRFGGKRSPVAVGYRVGADGSIGFRLGSYDKRRALAIDPPLSYSAYIGGSQTEFGESVAVDETGDAYVIGNTLSADLPTTANAYQPSYGGTEDTFVAKVDVDRGELVYTTYLGGSGVELGFGVAVDGAGSAYVTGATNSADFPTVAPLQAARRGNYDVFVAKLGASGSDLAYSTYLGGTAVDAGNDVAVTEDGTAFITGITDSSDFPTANAEQPANGGGAGCNQREPRAPNCDAFVARLAPSGSALAYSTYLGGSLDDQGRGIAVDAGGHAYVVGATASADFPTENAFQERIGSLTQPGEADAFVSKLEPGGAVMYSTFLGGNEPDFGNGIAADAGGSAYVTGRTESTNFPLARAFQAAKGRGQDGFVTKLVSDGSAAAYSTYLGGNNGDIGNQIAVDSTASPYVAGQTASTDFPTKDAFQAANKGTAFDAFVTKMAPDGLGLAWSTYLGGSGTFDMATGIALRGEDRAVVVGSTDSNDFPQVDGGQAARPGGFDAFLVAIGEPAPPEDAVPPVTTATLDPSAPDGDMDWYRSAVTVTLTATDDQPGTISTEYTLDGSTWQLYSDPFTVAGDGVHTVAYRSTDPAGNEEEPKSRSFKIDRTPPVTEATLDPPAPDGDREGSYRSGVTVSLAASDAASGVAETLYTIDGTPYRAYTGPFRVENEGEHEVTYVSNDVAGNAEQAKTVSFTIESSSDSRPPEPSPPPTAPGPEGPSIFAGLPPPLDALAPRTSRGLRRFLISRRALALTRRGTARVRVSCRQEGGCRGVLTLRASARSRRTGQVRAVFLGRRAFRVRAMRRGIVAVRLRPTRRRLLARSLRLRVRATARVRPGIAGRPVTTSSSFRLVRSRAGRGRP